MFVSITLGMILVFKWVVKIVEFIFLVLRKFILTILRRQNPTNAQREYRQRLMFPFIPEIFIISRDLALSQRSGGLLDKQYFKMKKTRCEDLESGFDQCSICLDTLQPQQITNRVLSLPCDSQKRHAFHEKCLKSWLKIKQYCPLCKKSIQSHRQTRAREQNIESSEILLSQLSY